MKSWPIGLKVSVVLVCFSVLRPYWLIPSFQLVIFDWLLIDGHWVRNQITTYVHARFSLPGLSLLSTDASFLLFQFRLLLLPFPLTPLQLSYYTWPFLTLGLLTWVELLLRLGLRKIINSMRVYGALRLSLLYISVCPVEY